MRKGIRRGGLHFNASDRGFRSLHGTSIPDAVVGDMGRLDLPKNRENKRIIQQRFRVEGLIGIQLSLLSPASEEKLVYCCQPPRVASFDDLLAQYGVRGFDYRLDMCRFLVYKGKDEILLSKLILEPSHSILTQSYDSRLRLDTRRPHNGDGFGVGYYTSPALGPEPCIFTSTIPAWNCNNLKRLASKTTSSLIFAHVRAATEGALAESNCHPFQRGSLMWMHNGGVGAWKYVKRRLADSIGDRWFESVQGGTDSEWAFALFLNQLESLGVDPDAPPAEDGFGHAVLRKAMLETIRKINDMIKSIPPEKAAEVDTRSLLNFAVTDGSSIICTRYVGSKTDEAASLYFSSGTSWKQEADGVFKMERRDKGADIVLVASEPLTFERDNWVTVPTNSVLTIHKQTVMIHPIIDEFYSDNPSYTRSSAFANDKGLVSKAPDALPMRNDLSDLDAASRRLPEMQVGCN